MHEQRTALVRRDEKLANSGIAFLTSLCVHVGLMLVLALCVYTAGKNSRGILVTARLDDTPATELLDVVPEFELEPEPLPDASEQPTVEVSEVSIDVDIDLKIDTPTLDADIPADAALTAVSADQVVASLQSAKSRRGASFFGTYATGNRFVYVLDSSRSMKGERWVYACNQLIDSLNGLEANQEFLVICFDVFPTVMFNTPPQQAHFYEATPQTIARVRRWLRSRELGHATMPATALQLALLLGPDAIFLLSDGELQDNTIAVLRMQNQGGSELRQIPIHTIHLFSAQGRLTLQQIALENGGTFKPITAQRAFGRLSRR